MIVDITILNIIRLITGTVLLAYASYTDIKTRRAANILWVIMAIVGLLLLLIQYLDGGFPNIWYLIFIPIMIALMYLFFQMRLLFGGADAKALMALAILVPIQPTLLSEQLPIWKSFMPGSWIIFANATILFLLIPISLLIYNIGKHNLKFPHSLLGYVITVEKAKQKFVWPLEKIKNGKRKLMYMPKNFNIDEELAEFEKQGVTEIWVTPKIPFMIPLLIGFLVSFLVGDLLLQLVRAL